MPQISPVHASGSYQGQAGSPFDVTAGLSPTDLPLSKLRVVSRRLVFHLPDFRLVPSISGFLEAFDPSSTGLPILRAIQSHDRHARRLQSWLAPMHLQHLRTATSHSSLKLSQTGGSHRLLASLCMMNVSSH
jgi:hypothetical protein